LGNARRTAGILQQHDTSLTGIDIATGVGVCHFPAIKIVDTNDMRAWMGDGVASLASLEQS
jgi:hypothetical protein